MDGMDATGRRVSLLINGAEAPLARPLRSHTSSYAFPVGSLPTPRLSRSDSSGSVMMQASSPRIPEFGSFDGQLPILSSLQCAQQQFFDIQQNGMHPHGLPQSEFGTKPENSSAYGLQIVGQLPDHTQPLQVFYRLIQMPNRYGPSPAPTPVDGRSKKNSYPCPMAKQYRCNDYFTTSGHAARHAKKHIGKRDARCPECDKAFTRKDNMEQHRRTHQSDRSAKGNENGVKNLKTAARRPRPSPLRSSVPATSLTKLDPALSSSSNDTAFVSPALHWVDTLSGCPPAQQQRHACPNPIRFSMSHGCSTGSSSGLDALAIAASGERRKFE